MYLIFNKEHHQTCRHCARDAIEQKDDQEFSKADLTQWQIVVFVGAVVLMHVGIAGWKDARLIQHQGPQEEAQEKHDAQKKRGWQPTRHDRERRGHDHAHQTCAFAPCKHSALLAGPTAQARRPRLVEDAQTTEGQMTQRHANSHPHHI